MARGPRKLGEILQEWGVIDEQQLDDALKLAQGSGKRLGDALVEIGACTEDEIARILAAQFDLEYLDLDQPDPIPKENLDLLPKELVQKYLVLPVKKEGNRLTVVIHDPMDLELLDNLRFRMNCEIDTMVAARGKIKDFIDQIYAETKESIDQAISSMSIDRSAASLDASVDADDVQARQQQGGGEAQSQQRPAVRLVNHIVAEAIRGDASDIHIEPFEDRVRLRYRIDGVCHEMQNIPKRMQNAVIARLKVMADVKIQERRVPQDGRIKTKVDGKSYDMRFSVCPSYHGETVVMRILRPEAARVGMENLGMEEDTHKAVTDVIHRPNGVFLVTGPTGSGKTTSLYSCLDVLNRPDKKIITAEDPVEYNFPGINQCEVRPGIGMDFGTILRAMLRQSPNIILVGEVRDKEVGSVAIEAALTGHLVFSTLHTNDAPSAITRLIDMGLKPFLVASAIQAVLAQRLIRRLCPECCEPDPNPDPATMRALGFTREELKQGTVYRPVGCAKCKGGYKGRRGLYEMMIMSSPIRELAFKRAPVSQIRDAALEGGMRQVLDDGKRKILKGVTTPEEVVKVAQVEGITDAEEEAEEEASAEEAPTA
jgi:type IV pilus assembly protein PilB